mgnify:CR=1 FL=1|tara:strand:- start:942 stop:1310 length:369 start_codon:yes stop_codon:yes gene_type:complete
MIKVYFVIVALFLLSSCSTAEYKQANSACWNIGVSKYPVDRVDYTCQKSRFIEVPNGETICTSELIYDRVVTSCKEQTEQKQEFFETTCSTDRNQNLRGQWVGQCTRDACLSAFGNESCEVN